jgi:hypothetical protein
MPDKPDKWYQPEPPPHLFQTSRPVHLYAKEVVGLEPALEATSVDRWFQPSTPPPWLVKTQRPVHLYQKYSWSSFLLALPLRPVSITTGAQVGRPTLPLSTAPLIFYIGSTTLQDDGTVQTKGVVLNTVEITSQLGSRGTARFTTRDTLGAFKPTVGQEVVIFRQQGATRIRIFGGYVDQVEEHRPAKSNQILFCDVSCIDYGIILDRRFARKYYDLTLAWNEGSMVRDLLLTYASDTPLRFAGAFGGGTITEPQIFNYVTLTEAINKTCNATGAGLDFRVDWYGGCYLFPTGTGYTSAPLSLVDSSTHCREPRLQRTGALKANRVFVRPSRGLPLTRTETFVGNGVAQYFITEYVITELPVVKVNGVEKIVVAYNAYSLDPHDFSYVPDGHGVFQNPYQTPYTSSDTIEVIYPHPIAELPKAEDTVLIASEGLSEHVVEVRDVQNLNVLQDIADGWLVRLKNGPANLSFMTRTDGYEPGQTLSVTWTVKPFPIFTGSMVITQVSLSVTDKDLFWYTVQATNTLWQGQNNAAQFTQELISRSRQPLSQAAEILPFKIAKTIEGLTNPGASPQVIKDVYIVQGDGILGGLTFSWDSEPTLADITIDIFVNGVSIFGTNKLVFKTTDSNTVSRILFSPQPFYVYKGDEVTAEQLSGTDATAKDGTILLSLIR